MKTNTYKAVLNENKKYSTLEIPEGISFTRKTKDIKASINFSLRISEDSSESGLVCFSSVEDAKRVLEFNQNRTDIKGIEMLLKINNEWYKADGKTLKFPKEITIWEVKKDLNITDAEIAKMFGYANTNSYATSSAKKRYESGLVSFYLLSKKAWEKNIKTVDLEQTTDEEAPT